jgi:hypothetical protein
VGSLLRDKEWLSAKILANLGLELNRLSAALELTV